MNLTLSNREHVDMNRMSYSLAALALGILAALLFIRLPLSHYLILLGGLLFLLLIYNKIELGFGILIASMLFQRPILPGETDVSLTKILALPVLIVALVKILADKKKFTFQKGKDSLVLLLFAWVIASLTYASDVTAALAGVATFAQLVGLYFVLKTIIDNREQLHRIVQATVLVSIGIVIFSVAAGFVEASVFNPSLDSIFSERITGSSDDPNKFAMGLVFVIPLSIYLFLTRHKLYAVPVALFSFLLLATLSRGGYVAFAVVVILSLAQLLKTTKRGMLYSVYTLGVLVSGFLILNNGDKIIERVQSVRHYDEGSIRTRVELIEVAVDMGFKNPVFGVGLDNFRAHSHLYGNQSHFDREAHNGYLEVLATLGAPGFLMLLGLLYFAFRDIWRFENGLLKSDDRKALEMAKFIQIAFVGYLVAALFLTLLTQKLFWTLLALTSILHECCAEEPQQ